MLANTSLGNIPGIDSHEVMCHPTHGTLHHRGCVILAFAKVIRTAPWILIDQGVAASEAMLDIIGPLGKYVTKFEVSLRETAHDYKIADHDFSRCAFTYYKLPALEGHVFRVFEVTAATITGIFTIDHRPQRGDGMVAQLMPMEPIEDAIVLHIEKSNNHCYTFTLPEELHQADRFDAWASDLKLHENVIVEYYRAGWEDSLAASRITEAPFPTSGAPSCPICRGSGQRPRLPKFGQASTLSIVSKIFDPMGRIKTSELLDTILAPASALASLGASLPDGPVPIVDFAMGELTHVEADEGMPPIESRLMAPRYAGDRPVASAPSTSDEGRIRLRNNVVMEKNTEALQREIAFLRVQLQCLKDRDKVDPILTREQARYRDVAHQELQARTLAALEKLELGETLWEDSTQALRKRYESEFDDDEEKCIHRMFASQGACADFSQHLGCSIVMDLVRKLRGVGADEEADPLMAIVRSALDSQDPSDNIRGNHPPRCGGIEDDDTESLLDEDDPSIDKIYERLDRMQLHDDNLFTPGWHSRSNGEDEIMAYRTHRLVYLEDLAERIKDADTATVPQGVASTSQEVLRECYSEVCCTARLLRMKIESWEPEDTPRGSSGRTFAAPLRDHKQNPRHPVQTSEPPTQVIYPPPAQPRRGRGMGRCSFRVAPRCGARRSPAGKNNQISGPTGPPLCRVDGYRRPCYYHPPWSTMPGEYDSTCCMALPPHVSASSLILDHLRHSTGERSHPAHSGSWNMPIDPLFKGPICSIEGCKYPCFLDPDLGKYRNACGPDHLRLVDGHRSTAPSLETRPPINYNSGYCMLEGCFRPAVVSPDGEEGGNVANYTPAYMTYRGHCCVDHQILHRRIAEKMATLVAGRDGNHANRPVGWTRALTASWKNQPAEDDAIAPAPRRTEGGFADGVSGLDQDSTWRWYQRSLPDGGAESRDESEGQRPTPSGTEATLRPQNADATVARFGRNPSQSESSTDELSFDGCWLPRNPTLPGHGDVPCVYRHVERLGDADEVSTSASNLTSAVLDIKPEKHVATVPWSVGDPVEFSPDRSNSDCLRAEMADIERSIASIEAEVRRGLACMHEVMRTNAEHLQQCRLRLKSDKLLLEQWMTLEKMERRCPSDKDESATYDRYLQCRGPDLEPHIEANERDPREPPRCGGNGIRHETFETRRPRVSHTCFLADCHRPVHVDSITGRHHDFCGRAHAWQHLHPEGSGVPRCLYPGCTALSHIEDDPRLVHSFCCKRHTRMFADEISPHDDSLLGTSLIIGTGTLGSPPRCGGLSGSAICCGMSGEEDDAESPSGQIDEDEDHPLTADDDHEDQQPPASDTPTVVDTPPMEEAPAHATTQAPAHTQSIGLVHWAGNPGTVLPLGHPDNVLQQALLGGGTLADLDPTMTIIQVECDCHCSDPDGPRCSVARYVDLEYYINDPRNASLCPTCYPYPREMEPEQLQRCRPCRCACEFCVSTRQADQGTDGDITGVDGTTPLTPPAMEESEPESEESEQGPGETTEGDEAQRFDRDLAFWLSAHDQLIIDHELGSTTTPDTTMVEVQCYCHHEVDPAGTVPRNHCQVTRRVTYRQATEDQGNSELCLECYPYHRERERAERERKRARERESERERERERKREGERERERER